jgi:hypothetical protein
LCLADARLNQVFLVAVEPEAVMQTFSPELIKTMRTVLEDAMTKVPLEQATPGIKAYLAECILKAAAEGHTSYESLMATVADQLPNILSMFTGQ